jgi:spore maturation protein SpmA
MNPVFLLLIATAVLYAAFAGTMEAVRDASLEEAKKAVDVALGLLGVMALWLGLMRVLRDAGLLAAAGRALAPIMRRLFPDVPPEHPAMGAMIMNLAANMFGLGNAATPFGLKAMQELQRLNAHPAVATNAMVLFLAVNTSGVAVMPLGVIGVRAAMGAKDPAGIFVPSVLATFCSTLVAILVAKLLTRSRYFRVERYLEAGEAAEPQAAASPAAIRGLEEAERLGAVTATLAPRRALVMGVAALAVLVALGMHVRASPLEGFSEVRDVLGAWLLPVLMLGIVLFGFGYRVKVYESAVAGAREGFDIFIMIVPFLVTILVAVGVLRASGALDAAISLLDPLTSLVGFPAEALPMALVRPLSGSGALGVMTATMDAHGPDSFVGFLVCVMSGSTETTFYVLALYFGSVGVRSMRHALLCGLTADLTGFVAALFFSRLFWTPL